MSLALPTSLTWRDLLVKTYREIVDDDVLGLAAQLSYYFFLALFPAILFGLALASFFPLGTLTDDLARAAGPVVSPEVLQLIQDQMKRLSNADSGGLLTFGVLGALWSSSAAVVSIVDALNRAYDIEESRPWWKVRLVALGLTIGLAVFVLAALTLVLAGPAIADYLDEHLGMGSALKWTWLILQWPVALMLVATALALVFYFGPDADQDWVWITPGALIGAVLWLLVSLATKVYVANFTDYNAAYGSVGGVMVVLLWLYVSGIAVLVAAELNAEIEHASPHGKAPGQKTPDGRRVIGTRAARMLEEHPPEPERTADARVPWPSSGPPPAHGPALGAVAAAVILGVRPSVLRGRLGSGYARLPPMTPRRALAALAIACTLAPSTPLAARETARADSAAAEARRRGERFDRAVAAMDRVLRVWLTHADPRTLLLPDRIPGPGSGLEPGQDPREYTPHNSGADLYPYLILTAELTDPDLYRGRMLEMLRNEVRYTSTVAGIPGNLSLKTGTLGPPSMFGAGEYAKDGLLTVTEYLGRTPWYARMVDMIAGAMAHASVDSRFGKLPAADAETNGDYLQVLARLANTTGDPRFVDWARRIADAYLEEVIPGSHGVPSGTWDFTAHTGDQRLRLRDHGNELVVGLVLQYANEQRWGSPRAERWRPVIAGMLDRILASANADGMFYDIVDTGTLKPLRTQLSDNWGYVYGAVYAFYQCTGEEKYRDAVRTALRNLPKYRRYVWEPRPKDPERPLGSFDGYADTIESAIYLVAREPVPEALDWIESEMQVLLGMQRPDGHLEYWYGEGNFNRTAMLYALMQSRGVRPVRWRPGVQVGAVPDGEGLRVSLVLPRGMRDTVVRFDSPRHRRVLNLDRNYVRLNEFPEWFVVDETTLYRLRPAAAGAAEAASVRLGAELIAGIPLTAGDWIVEPFLAAK